jgi:hypothetical protein
VTSGREFQDITGWRVGGLAVWLAARADEKRSYYVVTL